MIDIVLNLIILAGLLIGSFTDIKKREVPDWISYGLVIIGLGLRLIYSLTTFEFSFILEGIFGLALCFLIACLMFYTGQWGGGDAKVLMGLGALVGLRISLTDVFGSFLNNFLVGLLINILVIGAVYGIVFGGVLATINRKKFVKEFSKIRKGLGIIEKLNFGVFLVFVIISFITSNILLRILLIAIGVISLLTMYLYVLAKAVENACLIKSIKPKELTEGDWIVGEVKHKGKTIASSKDLGLENSQIKKLIKIGKKVVIKEGIPFLPSFLIAYGLMFLVGNWFLMFF